MSEIPKVCPTCKHFYFDSGSPGYSTLTPGDSMDIFCKKRYWKIGYEDSDESYRKKMLTALTCGDYELVQLG